MRDFDRITLRPGVMGGNACIRGMRVTVGMIVGGPINVEIVKRCDVGKFVVLPKRWIVERTIAWLNRCRRLAKDWECLNRNRLAFLRWASVRLMVRKLCKDRK
jgi:hypothetical protein